MEIRANDEHYTKCRQVEEQLLTVREIAMPCSLKPTSAEDYLISNLLV